MTGVTIMRVVKALDAGPMISTATRPIGEDETSAEVEHDIARLGARSARRGRRRDRRGAGVGDTAERSRGDLRPQDREGRRHHRLVAAGARDSQSDSRPSPVAARVLGSSGRAHDSASIGSRARTPGHAARTRHGARRPPRSVHGADRRRRASTADAAARRTAPASPRASFWLAGASSRAPGSCRLASRHDCAGTHGGVHRASRRECRPRRSACGACGCPAHAAGRARSRARDRPRHRHAAVAAAARLSHRTFRQAPARRSSTSRCCRFCALGRISCFTSIACRQRRR